MATFEYGAFFIWGDNEFGQLGNKKRNFFESPYPKQKFELKHNVENISAGYDSCAVIVEHLERPPKTKKKPKEKLRREQVITDPNELKYAGEQNIKKNDVDLEDDSMIRKSMSERVREKISGLWHK